MSHETNENGPNRPSKDPARPEPTPQGWKLVKGQLRAPLVLIPGGPAPLVARGERFQHGGLAEVDLIEVGGNADAT